MAKKSDDGSYLDDLLHELKDKRKFEVTRLADDNSPCVVKDFIPTGIMVLDRIMGGGLPVGRLTEMYGDPSTGKSLIAQQIAIQAQSMGHIVVYCDTETAISRELFERLGVDSNALIYASPDTVEDVFGLMDGAISFAAKLDKRVLFIWDSVAATTSKAEESKDYGDTGYLTQSRIISQSLRKITRKLAKAQAAALFLNQAKEAIGVMFGNKTATFGGKAIPFHSSVRVELGSAGKIKSAKSKEVVGVNLQAVVVKNKVVAPFQHAKLPVYFGHGIRDDLAALRWLQDNGYITGTIWKVLSLDDGEVKFQTKGWRKVYTEYYERIADLILNAPLPSNGDDDEDEGYDE